MFTEHKSVFLFVDSLWSRAPGRASLLIQEEEVKEVKEVECVFSRQTVRRTESRRPFGESERGKNCFQYWRTQKEDFAMSWGTELWVRFNSF